RSRIGIGENVVVAQNELRMAGVRHEGTQRSRATESLRHILDIPARGAEADREGLFDLIRSTLGENQGDRKEQSEGQTEKRKTAHVGDHRGLHMGFLLWPGRTELYRRLF